MLSLSIKQKIISLTLLSFLGFSSIYFVGEGALEDNTVSVQSIQNTSYPLLELAVRSQGQLEKLSENFNLAVTIGDEELLHSNVKILQSMQSDFATQKQLLPNMAYSVEALAQETLVYFKHAEQLAQGMINADINLAEVARVATQNNQRLEKLQSDLTAFGDAREREFHDSVKQLEQHNVDATNTMKLFGLIAIFLVAIIGWLVFSGIRKDLDTITNKMNDIAHGDGDLTARLIHNKNDELKALSTAFNLFVDKLQVNITETIGNVGQLNDISCTLVSASGTTASLSTQQNLSVEEVSSSLGQLSEAAKNIAENANDASMAARSASEQAQIGEQQVQSTIASIKELTLDVNTASDVVSQLDSSTQSAGSILDAINAIAEQTNLLALNAAIEAARAGEQGRGFAVVADEVRTLAARTQSSTQEIQAVLIELQDRAKEATQIISNGAIKAASCVEESLLAEQSLQRITTDVKEITERNEMIAVATEEQQQTSINIDENVSRINDMSEGTANSIEEVNRVAQNIDEVTGNLYQLTNQFKVE